ncbi:hypothetical protein [Parasitella parasitica]|uniref:Uncharacterized protein n=1 Tax=Parasitella parasitica TaxID=35722 RepID=A0A0B7MWF4_9FUNG|nr:hypothetical protein [Parasitella parasitica]
MDQELVAKPNHELFCGNILTVAQKSSLLAMSTKRKQTLKTNVPQQTATPRYIYRNLKAINGVTKVNLKTFNSLKEAVLVATNSNKPLQVSKKMKCLSSDDPIKTFIAATQKEIHDKTFKPMKFTDSRRISPLFPLNDCKTKSIQIDQQAFWRIVNSCGKTNQEIKDSFKNKQNLSNVLIWGVDPGVTDIYTAADSDDASKKEIIRTTSCKEYYHMFGFNLAKQKRMQHQNDNQQDFDFYQQIAYFKNIEFD